MSASRQPRRWRSRWEPPAQRRSTRQSPLWPIALDFYLDQRRLSLHVGVKVRQEPGGAIVSIPGFNDMQLEGLEVPPDQSDEPPVAVALLKPNGQPDALDPSGTTTGVLVASGSTTDDALANVLTLIEEAFTVEVGAEHARSIAAAVRANNPDDANPTHAWHLAKRIANQPEAAAAKLAHQLLADTGTRWAHTQVVAAHTMSIAKHVAADWSRPLLEAAWLHDIGHAAPVADTGLHPLDGARWLQDHGWPESTCRLVAWHSAPLAEARLRGLDQEIASAFKRPPDIPLAALTWADMNSSPTGEPCTIEQRLSEILTRYPPGSLVHQATIESTAQLHDAVKLIESHLNCGGP